MKHPTAPEMAEKLYPVVPSAESYRIQQITELQRHLEKERDTRLSLHKKYKRGVNVLDGIDMALATASMGLGVSGVGLLSTIVTAPVVLALEIAALGCGLTSIGGRKLQVKAEKHDQIRLLAEAKINTVADHISKALLDGEVSDVEFQMILEEFDKFRKMKSEIRAEAKASGGQVTLDDEAKNALIAQGREEACASMLQKLGAN